MRTLRRPIVAEFHDTVTRWIRPFDVFPGTDGNDTYKGTGSDDTISGLGGNDTLSGGDGSDLIDGGEGDDILAGDAGDDLVRGGAGDDTITSTSGADEIDGGDGYDRWIGSYASATGAVTFDQRTGTVFDGTTLTGMEFVQLTTGSGADQFTMNGEQAFIVSAGGGSDTFTFDPTGGARAAAPLTVTLGVVSNVFSVTLQDGDVANRASSVEKLAITGSSGDDLFVIPKGSFQPSAVSLDGGVGSDTLTWDMTDLGSTTFVVGRDGSIQSNMATLANFETFNLRFYYATSVILGAGDDTVQGSGGLIKGGAGDDTISAGGRDAVGEVYGGIGNDTISVSGADMKVYGNDGDDVITTNGTVVVDGGLGYDKWTDEILYKTDYDQATNKFSNGTTLINIENVKFSTSNDFRGCNVHIVRVEDLTVFSRNYGDYFNIDLTALTAGITLTARFDGYGRIDFGGTHLTLAEDKRSYAGVLFKGTSGDDIVSLTDAKINVILRNLDGGAGFDTLGVHLAANGQFLVAEDGTITSTTGTYVNFERFNIAVDGAGSVVSLGGADDTITVSDAGGGANDLFGGGGADVMTGATGADTLRGGDGDDRLSGGGGDDLLNGGLGDDTFDGGDGIDTAGYDGATSGVVVSLLKSGAQDTKGAGTDTLIGIENVYGTEFKDKLIGDANANTLRGREGDDLLKGGAGNDRLEGGPGADRLAGGKGADTFAFMKLTDISLTGLDRITDLRHTDGDRIDLSNIDLSKDPGDQFFTFIGSTAFSGRDDIFELRVQDSGNGHFLVQGDVDHDGQADFTFDVKTDGPLVATDFIF
jgi:Ca2+-binding RTX toxin-like protein